MEFDDLILCRPACAADREDLMSFLGEIWQGEDYVPQEWDVWLYRERGLLAVAEVDARVMALGHSFDFGQGEWWLEGLRVHPAAWGRGIGSHMHDYFLESFLAAGGEVLRLATHIDRKPVHAMCARTNFEEIAQFTQFSTVEPSRAHAGELEESPRVDWPHAIESIRNSQCCRGLGGLMDYGWRFAQPMADRLGGEFDDRVLASSDGGWHILRMDLEEVEPSAHILATSSPVEDLAETLTGLIGWAGQAGAPRVNWRAPNLAAFIEPAVKVGMEPSEAGTLLIFERNR